MMGWLESAINQQRNLIENILLERLSRLAQLCALNWSDRNHLDSALVKYLAVSRREDDLNYRLLYAINKYGQQYSGNISKRYTDETIVGQDLSRRPYLNFIHKGVSSDFVLSKVYVDKVMNTHCVTALHSVKINNELVGYIAADFDLKDLPLQHIGGNQIQAWMQMKGDPSIRGGLFQQTRSQSLMDVNIDKVLKTTEMLFVKQGVFHAKLHFSSSRASLWSYTDPYRYRVHLLKELISPEISLLYTKTDYPADAAVSASMISKVFSVFKELRVTDETIYLRSASLNIMNGLVGLNFSCDGSHYIPVDEFLDKNVEFWFSGSKLSKLESFGV